MGERNNAIDWRRMQSLNPIGVSLDVNSDNTVVLGDRRIMLVVIKNRRETEEIDNPHRFTSPSF